MSTIAKPKVKVKARENLATMNAKGEYSIVEPLDYLILEQLQEEGTLMGKYYPLATTVPELFKTFEKEVPTSVLSSRLRVLNQQGLVVLVTMISRSKGGWQRTAKGKELMEAWQQSQK